MFRYVRPQKKQADYDQFSATEIYCPRCRKAMPVREKVALYLPSETLYHYICTGCGDILGKKSAPGGV